MEIIKGDVAVDDRGKILFVNDFNPKVAKIKRFYVVSNHLKGFVRAWHGHKKEAKYVFVPKGAAIIGIVPMDETNDGAKVVLSEHKPEVLYIPPGNYNGFRTLTDDTQIFFFSTSTVGQSKKDDIRKPSSLWRNLLELEER